MANCTQSNLQNEKSQEDENGSIPDPETNNQDCQAVAQEKM